MNEIILTKEDQQFLDKFIDAIAIVGDGIPQNMIGVKDINSVNVYCSQYFADTVGLAVDEILGKIYFLSCFDQFLDIVLDEDRSVIETKKTHTFLKVNKFHNVIKPMVIFKSPIINSNTNNVVGILFQGFEYSATCNIIHQINKLYNIFDDSEQKYKMSCNKKCIQLTKREK